MKGLELLVLVACCYLAAAGTLVYSPLPVYEVKYSPIKTIHVPTFDPSSCGNEVDAYIRTQYWYYLPIVNSQLWYVTHIRDTYGLLYIHQYRNYLGTFYAISRYSTPSRKISVVTFCRLGDGFDIQHPYVEPFEVRPFTISMDLGYGVYRVPKWTDDRPNWSWTWARSRFYTKSADADFADSRCKLFDAYTRKSYWYYLDGAVTVSSSNSLFSNYCYCTCTYVNRIGMWQVIGYYGPSGNVINTFVRLGEGYDPKESKKCKPYPSFNYWHFA